MKNYIVLILLLLFSFTIHSKTQVNSEFTNDSILQTAGITRTSQGILENYKAQIPVTIPASPEIAGLMKFIECPVDHSTGIPDITIPIYTVRIGGISLPINLSYHASGIKVNDIASTVGLGWVLNSGGFITQQVIGEPDGESKKTPAYKSQAEFQTAIDNIDPINSSPLAMQGLLDEIYRIIKWDTGFGPQIDMHSDRYVYHFGEHSGVFRYKFNTNEIYTLPYDPIQIKFDSPRIRTIDSKGNTYYFNKFQKTNTISQTKILNQIKQDPLPDALFKGNGNTWRLTKIVSANKRDSIELNYIPSGWTSYSISQMVETGNEPIYYNSHSGSYIRDKSLLNPNECYTVNSIKMNELNYRTINQHNFNELSISEIKANGKKIVDFIYATDRKDIRDTKLDTIKIYLDDLTQMYIFHYSYSGTSKSINGKEFGLRLMLDKLEIRGNSSPEKEIYSFKYNPLSLPPYCEGFLATKDIYHFHDDYWGYYKGSTSTNNIPSGTMGAGAPTQYQTDREPNLTSAQACILEEIHYPTGGTRKFEYEFHQNKFGNLIHVGGLRVRRITDFDGPETIAKIVEYNYTLRDGFVNPRNCFNYYVLTHHNYTNGPACYSEAEIGKTYYVSEPLNDIMTFNTIPALYNNISEIIKDKDGNTLGKTEYIYDETEHKITTAYITKYGNVPYHFDYGAYKPRLLSKTDYSFADNKYTETRMESYEYTCFKKEKFITGFKIMESEPYAFNLFTGMSINYSDFQYYINRLIYEDCIATSEVYALYNKRIIEKRSENNIITAQWPDYDESTLLLKRKELPYVKDNISIIETFSYPSDYPGNPVYEKMKKLNILNPIISKEVYKGDTFLQKITTHYKEWHNDIFAPETIQIQTKNQNTPVTRIIYYNYDTHGNPLFLCKDNAMKIVYLWSYDGQYPIAEIQNANYEEVKNALNMNDDEINLLSEKTYPSDQDWTTIDSLRKSLPNALITTYKYKPLIGMVESVNPRGIKTSYEYDARGRLKLIKDNYGNIIQGYNYHYRNP